MSVASPSRHGTRYALEDLLRGMAALAFPPHCVVCEEPAPAALCPACREEIGRAGDPEGPAPAGVDGAACVGPHEGALREAILALKFRRRVTVAEPLAELLAGALAARQGEWRVDGIVPVPSHRKRQRERGIDQTRLLARALSRRSGIPVEDRVLHQVRYKVPQTELLPHERLQNVEEIYQVPEMEKARVRGRRLLLLDDVTTTGATLAECARTLREAGAAAVYALTLSHGGS